VVVVPDATVSGPSGSDARSVRRSRETLLHVAALVLGPAVAAVLVGGAAVDLLWRTAALSGALTLVACGLVRAVVVGRAEWRRDAPSLGAYGRVAARFVLAFVLVVAATS
jgi:hypothetical protein